MIRKKKKDLLLKKLKLNVLLLKKVKLNVFLLKKNLKLNAFHAKKKHTNGM